MRLETARVLSGERGHLEWLVDHQADLDHREVYADWLEERGDKRRATALRATTRFLRTGEAAGLKTTLSSRDAIWSELIGLEILRAMAEEKVPLAACGEWLATGTPALALETVPMKRRGAGLTRAWGDPELPRGPAWPTARDCRFWDSSTPPKGLDLDAPCKFNLQLDVAELQPALAARSRLGLGRACCGSSPSLISTVVVRGTQFDSERRKIWNDARTQTGEKRTRSRRRTKFI